MDYGGSIDFYEELRDKGHKTPLDERPKSNYYVNWYIEVFNRLSNSRPIGNNTPSNIPFSDYEAYFNIFDPIDDISFTISILQRMDQIYLKDVFKEINRKMKSTKTTSKRKR